MVAKFLDSRTGHSWNDRTDGEFTYYQGQGPSALEVVVVEHGERPTNEFLQSVYSDRRRQRVNPILVVAIDGDYVWLCGPTGENPSIYRGIAKDHAERVCDAALDEPDRLTAERFLTKTLPQLEEELERRRNEGLLTTFVNLSKIKAGNRNKIT